MNKNNKNKDPLLLFSEMCLPENRIKTFRRWPFRVGSCTAEKMAVGGFYMDSSDDTIKCYYCSKALEGWEKNDIPFEEHKKHAAHCPFVKKYEEPPEFLTIIDLIDLEKEKRILMLEQEKEALLAEVDGFIQKVTKPFNKTQEQKRKRRMKRK